MSLSSMQYILTAPAAVFPGACSDLPPGLREERNQQVLLQTKPVVSLPQPPSFIVHGVTVGGEGGEAESP